MTIASPNQAAALAKSKLGMKVAQLSIADMNLNTAERVSSAIREGEGGPTAMHVDVADLPTAEYPLKFRAYVAAKHGVVGQTNSAQSDCTGN